MMNIYKWFLDRKDSLKRIYAYILSPLFIWGQFPSEVSRIYGYKAMMNIPFIVTFRMFVIGYLPLILPSALIRFAYFRRGDYGKELYVSMMLSSVLTLVLFFVFSGVVSSGLGFLDTLVLYCVLTYGSTLPNTVSNPVRYILTALTLMITFSFPYALGFLLDVSQFQPIFPIWWCLLICFLLHSHNLVADNLRHQDMSEAPSEPPSFSGDTQNQVYNRDALIYRLVNVGLSSIGRKTQEINVYINDDGKQKRRLVERPFLKQLATKYQDERQRKTLSKHFMLYKEMCLYVIYASVLKDDNGLHDLVKDELKERLSSGLSVASVKWRDDYVYKFSRAFYDEYRRSRDLSRTLSYTFWSVASEKYPEIVRASELPELMQYGGLVEIYRYSYKAIDGAGL